MDNVDEMKVAELREELSARGLDTKGTKPILVKRLKEYMEANPEAEASMAEEKEKSVVEATPAEEDEEEAPAEDEAAGDAPALQGEEAKADAEKNGEAEGEEDPQTSSRRWEVACKDNSGVAKIRWVACNKEEDGEETRWEAAWAAAWTAAWTRETSGEATRCGNRPAGGADRRKADTPVAKTGVATEDGRSTLTNLH